MTLRSLPQIKYELHQQRVVYFVAWFVGKRILKLRQKSVNWPNPPWPYMYMLRCNRRFPLGPSPFCCSISSISVFNFFCIFLIICLVRYATVGYNAARYKDQFVPSVKMWVFEVGTHFIYSLVYGSYRYLDRKCTRYYFFFLMSRKNFMTIS